MFPSSRPSVTGQPACIGVHCRGPGALRAGPVMSIINQVCAILSLPPCRSVSAVRAHYGPPYCPAAAAAATAAATAEATVRPFSRRRPLPASAGQLSRVGRISRCLPLSRAIARRGRVAWARAEARALPAAMIATCAARRWAAARAGAAPPPIAADCSVPAQVCREACAPYGWGCAGTVRVVRLSRGTGRSVRGPPAPVGQLHRQG